MTNNYYQEHKERLRKEAHKKKIKIFLKRKKTDVKKRPENNIRILLKKKKKKSVCIIVNVTRIFLRNKSRS